MATKVIKDEIIRVRVTSDQKEKLKKIAKEKGKSMSEILSVATENEIKNYEEKQKSYEKICERVVATEEKIQEIKLNLEERKLKNKKSFEKKLKFFSPYQENKTNKKLVNGQGFANKKNMFQLKILLGINSSNIFFLLPLTSFVIYFGKLLRGKKTFYI